MIDKRTEIIMIGTELISFNGYKATGIDAILKKAGVPKGSFYHYFSSKEDFGLAVIDHFAGIYNEKLDEFLLNDQYTPLERIRNYLTSSCKRISETQFSKGCLIGNLSQELAAQNENFRSRLEVIFNGWKNKFAKCIKSAQDSNQISSSTDALILADFFLTAWEGAILRAKVMKSEEPIKIFISTLFEKILHS